MRIKKFIKVTTAKGIAGYDICNDEELQGLASCSILTAMGWVGSDVAYDTVLEVRDSQSNPIALPNHNTVAGGFDASKHISDLNYRPQGKISIKFDVGLGAGDAWIWVEATL